MVEIVRTLEQPAPSTAPASSGGQSGKGDGLGSPTRMVKISGRDLKDEFLDERVQAVTVKETARGLSRAVLRILNQRLTFTDHELLQGQDLEVEIFTGYTGRPFEKRGTFRAAVPRYAFGNQAMPIIELECFGEEWPLAVGEERRVYENLRDSEIAGQIASRHRLKTDVQSTNPVYEHVAQFNMTDMEFLENRALLYGYDIYVQDGMLHFHEPRFEHSGLSLWHGGGEKGILTSFDIVVDPWIRGSGWTKSGIDRLTGEEWEYRIEDKQDAVAAELIRLGGSGFQKAGDLAKVGGSLPRRFIVGDGHELTSAEGRQQAESYAKATEWIVVGSARVRGIELLHARQVVTIMGIGHLSGDYYVTEVTHQVSADSGYNMTFKVTRPGTGKLEDLFRPSQRTLGDRRNVTNIGGQVGTAVISG